MADKKPANPTLSVCNKDGCDSAPHCYTLRDLFAAAALAGMYADPNECDSAEELAAYAYEAADAMLKEREKNDG